MILYTSRVGRWAGRWKMGGHQVTVDANKHFSIYIILHARDRRRGQRARAVKGMHSKCIGLSPREFESHRCRFFQEDVYFTPPFFCCAHVVLTPCFLPTSLPVFCCRAHSKPHCLLLLLLPLSRGPLPDATRHVITLTKLLSDWSEHLSTCRSRLFVRAIAAFDFSSDGATIPCDRRRPLPRLLP